MATKKIFNNATLTIRLPDPVLKQFEQIAHGLYKSPSELTRQLITDYVNNRRDVLTALSQEQSKQKPKVYPTQNMYPTGNDMSVEDEW